MNLQAPERLHLAHLPTPLQKLERTSHVLGVEFYVKRDDLTGSALSGNKVRKLEFLIADALAQGCDTLITGGGEQSNHCRATALAAAKVGMHSHLCLRVVDKTQPPPVSGNILLDNLAGASIQWIDHDDWKRQSEVYEAAAGQLRKAGRKPYIIPEGGSNALGAWGYVECAHELDRDLGALPEVPTTIAHACGSGGTAAGLVIGAKALDFAAGSIDIVTVNVCDDEDYFRKRILGIARDFQERFAPELAIDASDIKIVDGYVGAGYAKSRPEELRTLQELVAREGIVLDPVYTGKAYYALVSELAKDRRRFGERIVFVHTGGIFGLFPKAELFSAL